MCFLQREKESSQTHHYQYSPYKSPLTSHDVPASTPSSSVLRLFLLPQMENDLSLSVPSPIVPFWWTIVFLLNHLNCSQSSSHCFIWGNLFFLAKGETSIWLSDIPPPQSGSVPSVCLMLTTEGASSKEIPLHHWGTGCIYRLENHDGNKSRLLCHPQWFHLRTLTIQYVFVFFLFFTSRQHYENTHLENIAII